VAQMAQQRQSEARERERIDQELRVARVIQQTLLPKEVPALPGWEVLPFWQPARAVSGDFYDFIPYPDGKVGIVVADVTDKGVPAALVMATTRSIIRSCAERSESPGQVLFQANNLLCPDIPPRMFVTLLYAILDPISGCMRYANAGQNMPYMRTPHGLDELCARGMPLGLFPGMEYEELETPFEPGDMLLLSSDGLVEAHNAKREMYGFPRMRALMEGETECQALIQHLLRDLAEHTGPDYEQEDDITLLVISRLPVQSIPPEYARWEMLADFDLPSQPGNERQAANQVISALQGVKMADKLRGRIETAVAESAMNAMEYGNRFQMDIPTGIQVLRSGDDLVVRVSDQGGEFDLSKVPEPDLEAKLAGQQSPRGWGVFLIKNMVDDLKVVDQGQEHTLELFFKLKEG
jgi:anti-sigma regulatory factor (Ser/Thr protein kinase)